MDSVRNLMTRLPRHRAGAHPRAQARRARARQRLSRSQDRGISLIETMIAVFIALFGVFSIGSAIFIASVTTKNQGTEATRATVYGQDKMEKLLSLDFNPTTNLLDWNACTQTASAQPSFCNTTGISGWTAGLLAGGSVSSLAMCGAAIPGYEDFLDANGIQLTGSSCSALGGKPSYIRQWQITDMTSFPGGPPIKQITVAVYPLDALNGVGSKPIIVVTSVLSDPN